MAEIATVGFGFDPTGTNAAYSALDRLTRAAKPAQAELEKIGKAGAPAAIQMGQAFDRAIPIMDKHRRAIGVVTDNYDKLGLSTGTVIASMAKGMATELPSRLLSLLGPIALGFGSIEGAAILLYETLRSKAPTAEDALKEHDRLLKIVKQSYDRLTDSASKWADQSKAVTQLQLLKEELDLRRNLTQEVVKGLRPTVDMNMFGPKTGAVEIREQFKPFADAIYTLNDAWQNGTPDVRRFMDEVARIALLRPELREAAADLLKSFGQAGELANALKRVADMQKLLTDGGKGLDKDARDRLGIGRTQINQYQQLMDRTRDRIEELRLEGTTAGQTAGAVSALKLQHEAERAAKQSGVPVNQKRLDQLKDELVLAERMRALGNIRADIDFASKTAFLSEADVQIAERLRVLYGNNIPAALASSEAAAMRATSAMRDITNQISGGLTTALVDVSMGTKTAGEAFQSFGMMAIRALDEMLIKLFIIEPLMRSLGAGFGGGGFLSLLGIGGGSQVGPTFASGSMGSMGGIPFPIIGGNAAGTDNWRGGPTWVGERGPEIINLPRGAQVIPNHAINGMGGGGTVINQTFHQDFRGVDPSMRAFIASQTAAAKDQAVREATAAVAGMNRNAPGYIRKQ